MPGSPTPPAPGRAGDRRSPDPWLAVAPTGAEWPYRAESKLAGRNELASTMPHRSAGVVRIEHVGDYGPQYPFSGAVEGPHPIDLTHFPQEQSSVDHDGVDAVKHP